MLPREMWIRAGGPRTRMRSKKEKKKQKTKKPLWCCDLCLPSCENFRLCGAWTRRHEIQMGSEGPRHNSHNIGSLTVARDCSIDLGEGTWKKYTSFKASAPVKIEATIGVFVSADGNSDSPPFYFWGGCRKRNAKRPLLIFSCSRNKGHIYKSSTCFSWILFACLISENICTHI